MGVDPPGFFGMVFKRVNQELKKTWVKNKTEIFWQDFPGLFDT